MAIEVRDIAENVKSIDRAITDIKFSQDKLEKYLDKHDINEAIKMLESIDASLMDLKDIHNTLSSLESSLEIITAHPAFTKHKHDDDLF